MTSTTETLRTETRHDTITVRDVEGGVWWPSEEAHEAIWAAADPAAEALRICRDEPMRGTWAS